MLYSTCVVCCIVCVLCVHGSQYMDFGVLSLYVYVYMYIVVLSLRPFCSQVGLR